MSNERKLAEKLRSSPRTWLVTGAAGFIGSHLVETLLKCDQKVIGLDNFSTGKQENVTHVLNAVGASGRKNYRFMVGDIRVPETCRTACQGVDVVLHQAALGSVPRSMSNPVETNSTNIDGFLNMLMAARDADVARFVYASSSSTYGDCKQLPMIESEIGKPLSPYALTKYVNELYAGVFDRCYGMETVGLRYFNVFGPRQDPDGAYAAVIPRWISALLRDEPVYINGDGTTSRDFCFIRNVVQANLLAATTTEPLAVNEVYNVAVGSQTTLSDLFKMIRLLVAEHRPDLIACLPEYRDFRPGDILDSKAEIAKASALLGYQPDWEVLEGMKWTVDWFVENLSDETRQGNLYQNSSSTADRQLSALHP